MKNLLNASEQHESYHESDNKINIKNRLIGSPLKLKDQKALSLPTSP